MSKSDFKYYLGVNFVIMRKKYLVLKIYGKVTSKHLKVVGCAGRACVNVLCTVMMCMFDVLSFGKPW